MTDTLKKTEESDDTLKEKVCDKILTNLVKTMRRELRRWRSIMITGRP